MTLNCKIQDRLTKAKKTPVEFSIADLDPSPSSQELASLRAEWATLPKDEFAENTPHVRRRLHASFMFDRANGKFTRLPPRQYFQDLKNNSVYGGKARNFSQIGTEFFDQFAFITGIAVDCAKNLPVPYTKILVHCHLMRITADEFGVGYPSPEGIHQDGFDFVSLHLINKTNCKGGQSIVTDGHNNIISAPCLDETLDSIVANDKILFHAALPFFAISHGPAYRDTLLFSYQEFED